MLTFAYRDCEEVMDWPALVDAIRQLQQLHLSRANNVSGHHNQRSRGRVLHLDDITMGPTEVPYD